VGVFRDILSVFELDKFPDHGQDDKVMDEVLMVEIPLLVNKALQPVIELARLVKTAKLAV
jgi:hypothetical protein